MDASCKIQEGIHSFFLVHNMCPELWVHIISCVVKVVEIICGIKTKYIKILCEGKIKSKSAKKAEKIFITGIVIVGYGTTDL